MIDNELWINKYKKNNNLELAKKILITSGLGTNASSYSGRGVYHGDLNENKLAVIFQELLKTDVNYATEFVEMVSQMKTLGATEFINSFMNFASNGFVTKNLKIEDSNFYIGDENGDKRDLTISLSIYSVLDNNNSKETEIRDSEVMKILFYTKIRKDLEKVNPNYEFESKINFTDNRRGKKTFPRKKGKF